jgi:hypothetical protein
MANWEFHFRNFDPGQQWFGAYHAGCSGLGLDWHDGRPNCWAQDIPHNPQGGSNSVYVPADFVVDFGAWFKVILEGLQAAVNVGLFIGSGGEDVDALGEAIADAFKVSQDVVQAEIANNNLQAEDLQKLLTENFATACATIGQSQQSVISFAQQMGFGTAGWGFISGPHYQSMIHDDNSTINGGTGWTMLRSGPSESDPVDHIANAAYIQNGHLIYVWDSLNIAGFWNNF